MKLKITILSFLWVALNISAQEDCYKVVAEQGDGIFSILRKQGLDPVKYYGKFLELNKGQLENGSDLVLGKEYNIPVALDSYKHMAVQWDVENETETSLFDQELETISAKSERLKNAVIYLMLASSSSEPKKEVKRLRQEIMVSMAEELMVHGAKVYLLQNDETALATYKGEDLNTSETEAPMAHLEQMRNYVDIINGEYLKNQGKYQRLLVINLNESVRNSEYYKVSVYHDKNPDGERFAKNIQQTLNRYSVTNDPKEYTEVFTEKNNLFLAKNVMPPITLVDIGDTKDPSIEGRISVKPDKVWLTNIITNGIFSDYANLEIE